MPAGPRHVIGAATIVVLFALAAPAAAIAGGGGNCTASACKVYHEQNAPSAGRQQPPQPTGPSTHAGAKPAHVPKGLGRVLARAGADKGPVKRLLTDSGLGNLRSGNVAGPSLLGAALDLGVGPMVLLAILLATAVGLATRGSVRGWLLRRRSSP